MFFTYKMKSIGCESDTVPDSVTVIALATILHHNPGNWNSSLAAQVYGVVNN